MAYHAKSVFLGPTYPTMQDSPPYVSQFFQRVAAPNGARNPGEPLDYFAIIHHAGGRWRPLPRTIPDPSQLEARKMHIAMPGMG
jgi:hypothetical protein